MAKISSSSSPTTTETQTPSNPTQRKMELRQRSRKMAVKEVGIKKGTKTVAAKKKKKLSKVDANKPKKPPTAFFYFLEDFRKGFQEQNPDVKSMREVGKACGVKWGTMTYEEKVQYYDIATEKRAKFEKDLADYVKKQESEKHNESDDDSEYDE